MNRRYTRRASLQLLAALSLNAAAPSWAKPKRKPLHPLVHGLAPQDDAFLDEMERRASLFFWEQTDPATGQILDRAKWENSTGALSSKSLSSIAATGFGLSALCIADHRRYRPHAEIIARVRSTLEFHLLKLPHNHGFFTHFNDVHTGAPAHGTEISSIDTAILMCGVLTARAYFKDPVLTELATKLYERVEWPWMLNKGDTFSMGYTTGGLFGPSFIKSRWSHYCELMMLYLLAIGSPTHPVDASLWDNFSRPEMHFQDFTYISSDDPLFVHQFSHAWFDFRGKRDKYANYFENSVIATKAHKAFCLSLDDGYTEDYWGVTASDSAKGYRAWGGPPKLGPVDGTVVPCASAGSLPFLPAECLRVQRALKAKYGEQAYGRYGFRDAFHPSADWYDADVLGIDLGISMLMAENLRSGFIWKTFMSNPEATRAMRLCGFRVV